MNLDNLEWVYVPVAFIIGILHALEPGHGKTVMAAYLIGSRGTPRQAVLLGIVIALTHTIIVITLAVLGVIAAKSYNLGKLEHYFYHLAAWMVIALGVWMILGRSGIFHLLRHHNHGHSYKVLSLDRVKTGQLVWLGITGGLLPCTGAVSVLLLSWGAGKALLGLFTVMAVSAGVAVTLVTLGLLAVLARPWMERKLHSVKWLSWAPIGSAVLITILGIAVLVFHSHPVQS
jgi:nickel/cobalt exporter